jgi:hypothetical protein
VQDSDCTSAPHGYCATNPPGAPPGHFCYYGCTNDGECAEGQICVCGDPVGHCVQATCTEDKACPGGLCASYDPSPGCYGEAFACQKLGDGCLGNGDCPSGQFCTLGTDGTRQCSTPHCAIGRPFLVEGAAILAPLRERDDFLSELRADASRLGEEERRIVATYWTDTALMEHASVAAFARFALELMSMGAPADLLMATQAAMADEIAHARDAFALASAYAGRDSGPGALDVGAALLGRSPLDVLRTAVLEGCVGETVAAVLASEALAEATEPAVRAALARVVPDETRHAELAWRFVRWVLLDGPVEVRRHAASDLLSIVEGARIEARATLRDAPTDLRGVRPAHQAATTDSRDALRAHGVLSTRAIAEIRLRVLDEVVAPCACSLVASLQRDAPPIPVASRDMPAR